MTEETTAPLASRSRLRAVAGELVGGPPATGLLAAFLFFVLFAGLRVAGLFEPLELGAFDRLVLLRAADGRAETRLVQVQATEADIERFGWPLSDDLAAVASEMACGGVGAS